MSRTRFLILLASLALAAITGCATNSPVRSDGAWAGNAAHNQSFSRLLVVGVSPDINQRCAFEDSMAQALRSANVGAETSCSILGVKEPLTREAVEKAIGSIQADAVLATRPLGGSAQLKEGGTIESRGSAYFQATDIGYGYGYYGVYGVPIVYGEFQTAPAEFNLEGGGRVRSEIYDTTNASMIYSVETEAKRLESRSQGLIVVTSSIADALREAGLVR
jgi:hypothetical protein